MEDTSAWWNHFLENFEADYLSLPSQFPMWPLDTIISQPRVSNVLPLLLPRKILELQQTEKNEKGKVS